jgi:uncharacterized protein (TIGR03437 family)
MTKSKSIVFALSTSLFFICGSASAQSITKISGDGQLACEQCAQNPIVTFDPLTVQVKDASGNPVAGTAVTWSYTDVQGSGGTLTIPTTTTDSNGMSQNTFFLSPRIGSLFATSFVQGKITATALGQSAVFTESDVLTDNEVTPGQGSGIILVQASQTSPQPGTVLTGPAGSTSSTLIQVSVRGQFGGGVPGVSVMLTMVSDPNGPTIACAPSPGGQPNTVFTDASGTGTCTPVFGGKQGTGTASVVIGDHFGRSAVPISFNVTQGLPGAITIQSGNQQSGNAASNLPLPLLATVVDQAGNPLPNTPVTWSVAPPNGATLFNTRTTSDTSGRVSTNVQLGSSPGSVQITVAVTGATPAVTATFIENVNVSITQLQIVAGNNQTAAIGTAFPSPLVVQVNNAGAPVPGISVTFAVTSGSATLGTPNPATTNAQGQAQITVQAGPTAGNVAITATIGSFTQTFTLTVSPPGPSITPGSFSNAASGVQGDISPCSLATITAAGLAPGLQGAVLPPVGIGLLPFLVMGDAVGWLNPATNNLVYSPIWSVQNQNGTESMTIEIPCELSPGPVQVTASTSAGSKTVTVQLKAAAPGIFQQAGSDKKVRAVILKQDGSFATKENPVRVGETAYMLVTGLGPVVPQVGTNQIGIPGTDANVSDNVVVGVNNSGVQVVSATYARDLIGVYIVGFVVPTDSATGDVNLAIAVNLGGTLVFGNGSIIPVQ